MINLLNAIYARFTNDATLTAAFPGGLHRDRAPEGTPMPYLVSHVVSSTSEPSYGTAARIETQIRFSAYGAGHDATGALLETLTTRFDSSLLTLTGGASNDAVVRLTDPIPNLHSHDGAGNDVWQWSVEYEYGIS